MYWGRCPRRLSGASPEVFRTRKKQGFALYFFWLENVLVKGKKVKYERLFGRQDR